MSRKSKVDIGYGKAIVVIKALKSAYDQFDLVLRTAATHAGFKSYATWMALTAQSEVIRSCQSVANMTLGKGAELFTAAQKPSQMMSAENGLVKESASGFVDQSRFTPR